MRKDTAQISPLKEVFAIWSSGESSVRLWMLPQDRNRVYPDWRDGFSRAKIGSDGAWGFDALCHVITTTTWRRIRAQSLGSLLLGTEEAAILHLAGLLQHNQRDAAEGLLSNWCPPSAVRLAIGPAETFALALRACQRPPRTKRARVLDT